MKYYVHNVPGRLRIKFSELKNDEIGLTRVIERLYKHDIIESATVNSRTGSVLIAYDPASVNHDVILDLLVNEGMIDLSDVICNDKYVKDMVYRTGTSLSKAIAGIFIDVVLEGTPLSLLSVFI
ncbi:MAG: hypothetical protein HQK91_09330 [Nitrospirae bacterium]|nr:hypothetical protein [Nitrospirota bacterium]